MQNTFSGQVHVPMDTSRRGPCNKGVTDFVAMFESLRIWRNLACRHFLCENISPWVFLSTKEKSLQTLAWKSTPFSLECWERWKTYTHCAVVCLSAQNMFLTDPSPIHCLGGEREGGERRGGTGRTFKPGFHVRRKRNISASARGLVSPWKRARRKRKNQNCLISLRLCLCPCCARENGMQHKRKDIDQSELSIPATVRK